MDANRYILTQRQFDKNMTVARRLQEVVAALYPRLGSLRFVRLASEYLACNSCGYYSSYDIEKFYLGLAQKYIISGPNSYKKKSCLFVTYRVSNGGHTKVMERWIAADSNRSYSIALVGQEMKQVNDQLPILTEVEKSGGSIFAVDGADVVERGLSLRKVASEFESIVLFTFALDAEVIIAFGSENFTRPVGYYNAADHMFWLGVSVVDVCAEMRRWGEALSLKHRGIEKTVLVPVPATEHSMPMISQSEARNRLGIATDCKLIVSAARASKFIPIADDDYTTLMDSVLSSRGDVRVVCIGVKESCFNDWQSVSKKWGDRFELKQYVPHNELLMYFRAADVVVDSYPLGGMVTLEDAVFCDTPILSMEKTFDFIKDSAAYVATKEELVAKTLKLLSDKAYAAKHTKCVRDRVVAVSGKDPFVRGIAKFFAMLEESKHRVRAFSGRPTEMTFWEKVRMHESNAWRLRTPDKIILYSALLRPKFLALCLCQTFSWIYGSWQCMKHVARRILDLRGFDFVNRHGKLHRAKRIRSGKRGIA